MKRDLFKYIFLLIILLFVVPVHAKTIPSALTGNDLKNRVLLENPVSDTYLKPSFDLVDSQFLQRRLENGLQILARENPGSGTVAVEVVIRVGAMEEMDTMAGISSVIQLMLLNGGGSPYIRLQEEAEAEGCVLNVDVYPDCARISMLATKDVFERNFRKLGQVMLNPNFNEEELDVVKNRQARMIDRNQSAYGSINEIFLKQFYRYHPYRQPPEGFKSTLERLTLDAINDFYNRFYSSDRIAVAIVGDINGVKALNLAQEVFKGMPRNSIGEVNIPWEPMGQEKKLYLATYSNTAWLFVGFPAPSLKSPDYARMKILTTILGEGMSSRLFVELREKLGLAYQLSANYPELDGPAHMILYVVTEGSNLHKCRRQLFKEINRIKSESVTPEELEAAKRRTINKMMLKSESNQGRAFTIAYYTCMGMDADFDRRLTQRIEGVTVEDVRKTARKFLENYTVLQVESIPPNMRGRYEDD